MIDIWGLAVSSGVGMIFGILIGLMPGLGVSSTFLLLSPVLTMIHPVYALFIFVSLLVTSQYFGSITALIYGVPGEVSSYPVIAERSNLLHIIDSALKQTARGSLLGSVFALVCFAVLMSLDNLWVYVYNYRLFAWIIGLTVVACILFGSNVNGVWSNLVLFVAGALLAKIGYNKDLGTAWGTFGITELHTGLPLTAVALGLLIIPALWSQYHMAPTVSLIARSGSGVKPIFWTSIGRGSLLGTLGGLVPGVTYMASTQLSYFVENWINRKHQDRSIKSVVSTSSADNAGATSSLYPLLWLGIPISLGEAMVVWLFDKHNLPLNWTTMSQQVLGMHLYWLLIVCFLVVNVVAYLLSWPGRQLSIWLAQKLLHGHIKYIIIAATVIAVVLLAQESTSVVVFWTTLLLTSAMGVTVKRLDWMPLIIGFVLQDSIESTLFKLGILSI